MARILGLLLALVLCLALPVSGIAEEDASEMLAELSEALELTEEQTPQVAAAFEGFVKAMEVATDVPEDAEPDTKKMIGDIKSARSDFRKAMEKTLTKEQFTTFEAMVDQVFQETFEDIAEIRIIDLEVPLELSEEQSAALIPVMGTAVRDLVATLFEYGDKNLNTRVKIKMGKKLKRIQGDMKKGMAEILSEEQMAKYEAMQEEKKNNK